MFFCNFFVNIYKKKPQSYKTLKCFLGQKNARIIEKPRIIDVETNSDGLFHTVTPISVVTGSTSVSAIDLLLLCYKYLILF